MSSWHGRPSPISRRRGSRTCSCSRTRLRRNGWPVPAHADRARDRRALVTALALILALMGGEIAAGIVAGSLALLADAGHLLTDAAALAAALIASRLASRPARGSWTFGLGRAEILPAQAHGIPLLLLRIWIIYGAVPRPRSPAHPHGGIALV